MVPAAVARRRAGRLRFSPGVTGGRYIANRRTARIVTGHAGRWAPVRWLAMPRTFNPPRVGEVLAGAFGGLLLISLFLPWYRQTVLCEQAPCPQLQVTAFEAFAVLDVFLVLVALGGLGLLALEITQRTPAVPVAWAAVATPLALVAALLVLWRVLAPPDSADDPIFALLGLAACVGLTAGCFFSMRNDRPRSHASTAAARRQPRPVSIPDEPATEASDR